MKKTESRPLDAAQSIRVLMAMHNLSEFRFAIQAGVSQSSVSNWLLGKSEPGTKAIKRICQAFSLTIDGFYALGNVCSTDEKQLSLTSLWVQLSNTEQEVILKCIRALAAGL